MTKPQSTGMGDSERGSTSQEGRDAELGGRKGPGEGGQKPEPSPLQNQTQEERRADEPSASRDPQN